MKKFKLVFTMLSLIFMLSVFSSTALANGDYKEEHHNVYLRIMSRDYIQLPNKYPYTKIEVTGGRELIQISNISWPQEQPPDDFSNSPYFFVIPLNLGNVEFTYTDTLDKVKKHYHIEIVE